MAALIDPVGEFPLNEDWAYAWSVRALLRVAFRRWLGPLSAVVMLRRSEASPETRP